MSFALEELQCCPGEFLVHKDNVASRRAVAGLGSREDGMLRRVKNIIASRLEARRQAPRPQQPVTPAE